MGVAGIEPVALEDYQRAQDERIEARNGSLVRSRGAAMSGLTRDEIVDLTGSPAEAVVRYRARHCARILGGHPGPR